MTTQFARLDAAVSAGVDDLTVHQVREQMQLVKSVQAIAAAHLLQLNRRMEQLASCRDAFVAVDPHRELRNHGGLSGRDARAVEIQSEAVAAAPTLGRLFAAGGTTASHVESVGRALDSVGEGREALLARVDDIVHHAATLRPDEFDRYVKKLTREVQPDDGLALFERQRRLTNLRWWNDTDGMTNVVGRFDPLSAAVVISKIERRVEQMFHTGDRDVPVDVMPGIDPNDHRRALAFIALCEGASSADTGDVAADPRSARAEVVVHVDLRTLQQGLHAQGVCRTSHGAAIPPATARRLACDAEIVPMVMASPSAPVDVGRSRRLATVHQRRMLEAVHLTCAMPDCTVAFARCSIHHIVPWEHGGPTDLHNLVPLCSRHHHAVHEGGWRITLDPATRELSVQLPGRPVDDLGHGHQSNGALDLSPFSYTT